MNTVTRAAAASADGGMLLGVMTALFLAFYIGSALYMFRKSATALYAQAERLPLED